MINNSNNNLSNNVILRSSTSSLTNGGDYHGNTTTTNTNNGQQQQQSNQHLNTNGSIMSSSTSPTTTTTDGWLELFLTPSEKLHFSKWNEIVDENHSIVHYLFRPVFRSIATRYLPDTVAPNLVTLTGFVMLVQGWYLTNTYGNYAPISCTWLAVVNIMLFFITSSITTYHADRIRQHTSLSDLFKYSCDSGSTVFFTLLTVYCFGALNDITTQWYAVQACQLVLLLKHISAFERHAGIRYRLGAGPGEVLLTSIVLLMCRATVGLDRVLQLYYYAGGRFIHSIFEYAMPRAQRILEHPKTQQIMERHASKINKIVVESMDNTDPNNITIPSGEEVIKIAYYTCFILALIKAISLSNKHHGWTRFGLTTSLLMRLVPALLIKHSMETTTTALTVTDVICDGLFVTVLTSDIALAKMANRELHPWVVLMSVAAVLSYPVILTLVAVYYIAVFSDLCFYLNMPLLATCRNVYCDGIYDLCHIGHKRAFQNALAFGNRLFVGVVGDEDASHYKRPPIMTAAERCAEVEACKAVTKVIPNAPCFGLTMEFLESHQIHVVAMGEEYIIKYPNPHDDPYYKIPRLLGIAKPLPRTNTLSTTDLIERIIAKHNAALAATTAAAGGTTTTNNGGSSSLLKKKSPT